MASKPQAGINDKDIFTTGEAASICSLSQQTIIRCFDAGRIDGFRVPGSRFRRIPREALLRFMRDNAIPIPQAPENTGGVLLIASPQRTTELTRAIAEAVPNAKLRSPRHALAAGFELATDPPALVVLDAPHQVDPAELTRLIAEQDSLASTAVMVVGRPGAGPPDATATITHQSDASPNSIAREAARLLSPAQGG